MAYRSRHKEYLSLIVRYSNLELTDNELKQFNSALQTDIFLAEALEGLSQLKTKDYLADINAVDFVNGKIRKRLPLSVYLLIASFSVLVFLGLALYITNSDSAKQVKPSAVSKPEVSTKAVELTKPYVNKGGHVNADRFFKQFAIVTDTLLLPLYVAEDETVIVLAPRPSVQAVTREERKPETKPLVALEIEPMRALSAPIQINASHESMPLKGTEVILPNAMVVATDGSENTSGQMLGENQDQVSQVTARKGVNAEPAPLGGNDLFRKYITDNTRLPEGVAQGRRINVRVEFLVSINGDPIDIKVVQGAENETVAAEAIRLIKEGPRWSPCIVDGLPVEKKVMQRLVLRP